MVRTLSFFTLLVLVCAPALQAAPPGLVAHWPFDEGAGTAAADASGNGNDGTVVGGAEWVPGQLGTALQFNGSNSFVQAPYIPFNETSFTQAMWINASLSANEQVVFAQVETGSTNLSLHYRMWGDGRVRMGFYSNDLDTAAGTIVAGEWLHVTYWYDYENTDRKIFINGVQNAQDSGAPYLGDQGDTRIGQWNSSQWFDGIIDDVQVYDRPLTDGEVMSIMAGLSNKALASNPSPPTEEVDVIPDVTLSWTSGAYASQHDVYLGTTFADVNEATTDSPLYMGRQAETTYTPADLELGQTYFWRIDEPNDAPDNTVFKGETWNFALEPVSFAIPIGAVSATATSADADADPNNTVNGAGLNEADEHNTSLEAMWAGAATDMTPSIQFEFAQVEKLDKVHVWNHNTQTESILGFGIKEALIEYSVDGETWTELGTVELAQAPGSATYTGADVALDMIVAKYVKITGLSNYSILGLPQKGLAEVRFYAVPMQARREIPATGSTGIDPLVDLSWRAGREAVQHEVLVGTDPNTLEVVATVDDAAYTAAVAMDTTVYWQVNEINDAMDPAVWEGPVWTLDTTEFITVDDMESYKSEDGSFVWETWVDGFGDDNNGALLGHNGDDMETDVAYDGGQSLPYYYGQGGSASSEAFRDIERDWGQHGIVSLSLMFYGSPANIAGPMYLKVNDEKIATYPTNSDLTVPQWQAWTIDLPASALGNVKSLAIGFESGTGLVLIDAIRLYSKASETVDPVVPDDTGLVAFYPFEGNANDASGNGNDGTEEGGPQYVTGQVGQALDCDGIDDFVSTGKVASQLGIDGNKPRTVSCWVFTRGYADGGIYDVGARVNTEDFCLRTLGDVVDQWRVQYWGGDSDFTFNTLERWVNFVHVHDGTHTMVYGDGRTLVNWEKTINTTDTNPFQIGLYGWPGNFFYGVIDEVRVYDRALTQGEAMGLAGRTDPIFKEF